MSSAYWQSQLAPLQNGVGNLSAGLMRLPLIQAQGQMMQQRAGLYQQEAAKNSADVGLVGAQTEHEQALTGQIAKIMALTDTIRTAGPTARAAMLAGKQDDPSIDDLTGAVAALAGANKGDVMKSIQDSIAIPRAAAGDVQGAANVTNPVSVANNAADNAEKAARPMIVPSGGTLTAPTGQPLATGGVTLSAGQTRYAPQGMLAQGMAQAAASPTDADYDPDEQPGQPAAPGGPGPLQVVASAPPLPPKPGQPAAPPQLPPSVQGIIAKAMLDSSTNKNQTISQIQQWANQGQPNAATIVSPAPSPQSDPEITLAMQAIAQGTNRAHVAAKYQKRTGKPFPTNGQ